MNIILKSFPQLERTAYSPEIEFLEIGGEKKVGVTLLYISDTAKAASSSKTGKRS